MKLNYKKLGNFIEEQSLRNKEVFSSNLLGEEDLLGIKINKTFFSSQANTHGTKFDNYKVIYKNQFAYNPATSRNGDKISIALLKKEYGIVSSAYKVFSIIDENLLNPDYLMLWFKRPEFDRYARFKSHGAVREMFSWEEMCETEVPIPDINIQNKIVKIIKIIENRIKIKKKINHNLYSLLINYFNEIFDDANKNCKLSDIVNIRRGASPRPIKDYISSTGINWLKISDVTGTEMPFIYKIKEKIIEEGKSKSVFIEKGTLVVSNSATPGIPKFIMVDTCVHDGWLVLNEYEENLRYYLYFLIVKIRKELINLAYGSVFNNLKTDTLKNYEISKPKNNQLDKFNKVAKPIMENINSNTKEILMLSKLQDALLPKLISGEIDISKINCDLD